MNFNPTPEQWQQLKQLLTSVLVSLVIGLLAIFTGYKLVVEPQIANTNARFEQLLNELGFEAASNLRGSTPYNISSLPMLCKQIGINCVGIWNGSSIKVYSDGGTTLKFSVDGATGDVYSARTITATNIVSQSVGFNTTGNGTAAAPVYTFASDADTGLYRVGANDIGITTNGVLAADVSATAVTSALPVVHPVGSAAAPSITFTGDTDTGLYRVGANDIGITTNGVLALDASATGITAALPVVNAVGTVSLPSVTFTGDLDTGLYHIGANNVGLATNGAKVFDCSATTCTTTGLMKGPAEGSVIINARAELTPTQIHNGTTLVTVPAGKSLRLVSAEATATGATCTTSTSVDLIVGSNHLVVFTVANLVRSTLLRAGISTGATVLADGASFTAQTAAAALTVADVTGTTAGCTSVIFNISYVLE